MRKLRFAINVTLDGCCDHREGVVNEELHARWAATLARADALVCGRVTYEMMEAAWRQRPGGAATPDAMPAWTQGFARTIDAAKKYVVTRTLEHVDWNAELVRGDLGPAVQALKDTPGSELFVMGAALACALTELGLIDEYEFLIHPRLVGHGPTLFEGLATPVALQLIGREELSAGVVAMRYVPQR